MLSNTIIGLPIALLSPYPVLWKTDLEVLDSLSFLGSSGVSGVSGPSIISGSSGVSGSSIIMSDPL